MKKFYFYVFMVIAVLIVLPANSKSLKPVLNLALSEKPANPADLCYATIMEDDGVYGGGIVSFDIKKPYTTLKRVYVSGEGDDQYFVGAATMAEGVYYAYTVDIFGDPASFCSINLETGEQNVLGSSTTLITDVTYDAKNKIMYGTEDSGISTLIYTVNLSDGTLTQVAEIKKICLLAIAIDKDGTLYGISDKFELCTIDLKTQTSSIVGKIDASINQSSNQSLLFRGNKLYLLTYGMPVPNKFANFILELDKNTGKATNIESEGSFPILGGIRLVGLCFPHPMEQGISKVVSVKTYGSDLGDVPKGKLAKVETNYYDANNNLLRTSMKGVKNGTEIAEIPSVYTVYNYNDKHQLVETYSRQYGMYDGYDYLFAAPKYISTYEYNTEGKMGLYFNGANKDKTTYDWQGDNLVNETTMAARNGNTDDYYQKYRITYSDFLEGAINCPRKVVSVSEAFNNYNYEGIYTYDSRNNKTSYITKSPEGKITKKLEWVYDEKGNLKEYFMYQPENNELKVVQHKVYTINGNETKIERTGEISYLVETRAVCDENTAPTGLTVTDISDAANPNTYRISCDAPAGLEVSNPAWDIYRDGIKLTRITGLTEGKIAYVDRRLKNDTYDYYVQTVNNVENGETYNVSNAVTIKVNTELSAATSVRYVSHETVNASNQEKKNKVTVAWDAPVSEFPIKGYNVYLGEWKNPVNEKKLLTETTVVIDFGLTSNPANLKQNVTVETVYEIGKIRTVPVSIDLENVSVHENRIIPVIGVNGNTLSINGEYSTLCLYNSTGVLLKSVESEPVIDFSDLPSGIYIVHLNHHGKMNIYKVIKN